MGGKDDFAQDDSILFKGLDNPIDDFAGFKMPDIDFGANSKDRIGDMQGFGASGLDDLGGMFGDPFDSFGGGTGKGHGKAKGKSDGGKGAREADPKQVLVSRFGDLPEEEIRAF